MPASLTTPTVPASLTTPTVPASLTTPTVPASLTTIQGLASEIQHIDYIYIRVDSDLSQIDTYLSQQGFGRMELVTNSQCWNEAFYVRRSWFDYIDALIYINLDHRTDRRNEMEAELKRVGFPSAKVYRMSAIRDNYGPVGCNLSHAAALRLAYYKGWSNVLILEDDFNFNDGLEDLARFCASDIKWDGVLIKYSNEKIESINDLVCRLVSCSNAAGYLVKREIMLQLSQCIEEAVPKLRQTHEHWKYTNDVVWCQFMTGERWYAFNRKLGYQRMSYSDLAEQVIERK